MESHFEKLLETRAALECALVYLAAQKAVAADGDKLRQPLSYAIAREVDYQLERDFDFHLAVADIADNEYLRRSLQSLMVQITEYLSRNRALLPEVHGAFCMKFTRPFWGREHGAPVPPQGPGRRE